MTVVTRFAPSPTGFLHIGGARTALFNWLYARHTGGKFLLRIEDTDRERSTDAAVDAILDGLSWLGLDWDGDAVHQFARAERHVDVVRTLLETGHAYHCYCSPEELAAMREKARAEGRTRLYDGTWRDRDPSEAPEGIAPVVRFKAPLTGETVVRDRVQGDVRFANQQLDDLVILRADGTPTYNLSVVVDDHDMGVTHVIRGDDHLNNAARQSMIYTAMGWQPPVFAHIPLIHGPDGAKLSKRHGALGVDAYRDMGYLPTALRNYLLRLGWSHGDDEIISTEQAIEWFDLDGIGRSAARFDFAKLESLNGHYLKTSPPAEILEMVQPFVAGHLGRMPTEIETARLEIALPVLAERAKTLVELVEGAAFLFSERPLQPDEKAAKQLAGPDAPALLAALADRLVGLDAWTLPALETEIRAFAEEKGLKLGKIAQPLRAALTGRAVSPGIFDVLLALGRDESIGRMHDLNQP